MVNVILDCLELLMSEVSLLEPRVCLPRTQQEPSKNP